MPIAEISKPSPLPEEGEGLWRLMSIKEVKPSDEIVAKYGSKDPRWAWEFQTQDDDICPETGEPWRVVFWTNNRYGNTKASLTRMYNMLIPKCTPDIAQRIDPEAEYVGKWFDINIKHVKKENGDLKADYLYIKPYKKKAARPVEVTDDEVAEDDAPVAAKKAGSPF